MAEQKKQKVSEITGGLEDAEALVTDFDMHMSRDPSVLNIYTNTQHNFNIQDT